MALDFLVDDKFYNLLDDTNKKKCDDLVELYIDYLDGVQAQRIIKEIEDKKQKTYSHDEVGKKIGLL